MVSRYDVLVIKQADESKGNGGQSRASRNIKVWCDKIYFK